jgi:hypothetical protein
MGNQKKWIHSAINPQHKGKLREELHMKKGQDIPLKKLEKAATSNNPILRKEAVLAETLRKMHRHKHK